MRARKLGILVGAAGFLAACLWPITNFLDANFSQISVGAYGPMTDIALVIASALTLGLVSTASIWWWSPSGGERWLAVMTTSIVLLFVSGKLQTELISVAAITDDLARYAAASALFVFLAAIWYLTRFEPVRMAIAIGATTALLIPVFSLAPKWIGSSPGKPSVRLVDKAVDGYARSLSGENAYVIILDGYGRKDWLASAGFDNEPFLADMRTRGFFVDDLARSNYTSTHVSIMAMLEADYPVDENSPRYVDRSEFYPVALNNGKVPEVVKVFSASGYQTIRASNQWGRCEEKIFNYCYFDGSEELSYPLTAFLKPTILNDFLKMRYGSREAFEPADDALGVISQRFYEISRKKPFFLFAHSLAPHDPFRFNSDCSRRSPQANDQESASSARPLYLAMVQCVNHQVVELIDRIIAYDPSAAIVVMADHGTDFHVDWKLPLELWPKEATEERLSYLSLIRLPASCHNMLARGRGQINVMRVLIGCLERKTPHLLPERSYLTVYENSPEFGKVHLVSAAN